jgi:hypothetical protein
VFLRAETTEAVTTVTHPDHERGNLFSAAFQNVTHTDLTACRHREVRDAEMRRHELGLPHSLISEVRCRGQRHCGGSCPTQGRDHDVVPERSACSLRIPLGRVLSRSAVPPPDLDIARATRIRPFECSAIPADCNSRPWRSTRTASRCKAPQDARPSCRRATTEN